MAKAKLYTPEEDAILLANPDKTGSKLKHLMPNRSIDSINHRRDRLGLTQKSPEKSQIKYLSHDPLRPLTDETAYFVRNDYAAKIKLGYTHEQAIKWITKAYTRTQYIIEDVLTNPIYDADVAKCKRKAKYSLKDKDRANNSAPGIGI